MERYFATFDRVSIITESLIVSGTLQAEFMGTKHNFHIYNYGTPFLVTFLVDTNKSMYIRYFGCCKISLDSICKVFILRGRHDLCCLFFHSLHYQLLHGRAIRRCHI